MSVSRIAVSQGRVVSTRQRGDDAEQEQRPLAEPVRAQRQRDDPDRERRLARSSTGQNASGTPAVRMRP